MEDIFNAINVGHPFRDTKPFRVAIAMFKRLGLTEESAAWLVKFWYQEAEKIKPSVREIKFLTSKQLLELNWNTLELFE
jgi:hypothetical protein